MLMLFGAGESKFLHRPSIIRFFRWFAIPMPARFLLLVCRCRRIAFAIQRMRVSNCCAALISTKKFSECVRKGVWPSEGSVSEEVLAIAHSLGVKWMATDEGVLGRSSGNWFSSRRWRTPDSDNAREALQHSPLRKSWHGNAHDLPRPCHVGPGWIRVFRHARAGCRQSSDPQHQGSAQPILSKGKDAMVPVILDGENAWEYYPQSGREFLRRFCDGLQSDPQYRAAHSF